MRFTDNEKAIIDSDYTLVNVRLEFPNKEIDDITNSNIYQESMSLEESLQDSDNIVVGKCNSSIFKIQTADFTEDISGAEMNVYLEMRNDDLGNLTLPFGKYIVSLVERTSDRRYRNITAYDYMTKFDVDIADFYNTVLYPTENEKWTVNQILSKLCEYIGVEYDTEFTLVNGNVSIGKNIEPTTLPGREFLQHLCEFNGVFGHFDYEGVLGFVRLNTDESLYPSTELNPSENIHPHSGLSDGTQIEEVSTYKECEFEDYDVKKIDSVIVRLESDDIGYTYSETKDYSNPYIIEGNSFTFGMEESELRVFAQSIFESISNFTFRPNETTLKGGLYFELGTIYKVNVRIPKETIIEEHTFTSCVLKREIGGIQAIFSTLSASGTEYQSANKSGLETSVSMLKGKYRKLENTVDEFSLDYMDYKADVSALFKIQADSITQSVLGKQGMWNTESYDVTFFELDRPTEIYAPDYSSITGLYLLNTSDGKLYKIQSANIEYDEDEEETGYFIDVKYTFVKQLKTVQTSVSSEIELLKDSITLSVNGSVGGTASISLTIDGETQQGSIDLSGLVTFNGLSSGTTTINGACIKTGTISCDRLKGGTLSGQTISGGTISGTTINGGIFTSTASNYKTEISGGIVKSTLVRLIPPISGSGYVPGITRLNAQENTVISGLYFNDSGTINTSGNLQVGANGSSNMRASYGYFDKVSVEDMSTTSGGSAVHVNSNGVLLKYTGSSKRFKNNIKYDIDESLNPEKLYDLNVCTYKFNDDYLDKDDLLYKKDVIGLIAEDVYEKYPIASIYHYDDKGNLIVDNWQERYIVPAMLKLIQNQKDEIDTLKEQVSFLLGKIND